jgi:hypothetical protein
VGLGDRRVLPWQRHETLGEVVDGAVGTEERDLTDRAVGERRPKALIHQLDEVCPWRRPSVEFKPVVP